MGIYIEDSKTRTVRHYSTSPKIEKAIETLLRADDNLVYAQTHKGFCDWYDEIKMADTIIEADTESEDKT